MKKRIIVEYIPCHYLSPLEIEREIKKAIEDTSEAVVTDIKIEDFEESKEVVSDKNLIKDDLKGEK